MTPYNYTQAEVNRLATRIYFSRMSLPDGFLETPREELRKIYNGIGPEHWSGRFRRVMTWLLDFLEGPALIHDWEYVKQPKTYCRFTVANLRLAKNARLDGHPVAGLAAGLLCQLFGWRAWKEGKEK